MLRKLPFFAALAFLFTVCGSVAQQPQPQLWGPPPAPVFNPAQLVAVGDSVRYSSYEVFKIGNGIYQLKDQGDPRGRFAGLIGADIYLILGSQRAMMIDLGNNYINGYPGDAIPARKNASEDLHAIIDKLVGNRPLDVAITHMHPDHDGMTGAFLDKKYTLWAPKGELLDDLRKQHNLDPAVYNVFDQQTKTFDLGDGRVVRPRLVRGHTQGCTVYILQADDMVFSGDCLGIGAGRSLRTADELRQWSADTQQLVDDLKASFSPFERYGLKVFTGHSVENVIPGFISATHGRLDLSYLDWRFVQDQALCGNAILKGLWLVPDSGLRAMEVINSQTLSKVSLFTYGIGAVEISLQEAYRSAGIKMPEEAKK